MGIHNANICLLGLWIFFCHYLISATLFFANRNGWDNRLIECP